MPSSLWTFRGLAYNLLQREISSRYVGSISGLFWILIHPLALLGIYSVVFTMIFRVGLPGPGANFVVFVALGLWPWLAFQEGVQRGALAVQANAGLVRKVAFPNELLVHSAVTATYAVHGSGFLAALCVIALVGGDLHLAYLPHVTLLLLFQLLFTLGVSLILSALQVLFKDIEHFLSPFLMIWFYATPVLYTVAMVPGQVQQFIHLNPLAYPVGRIRDLLTQGGGFVAADVLAMAGAVVIFATGRWLFNRLAPHFEDFL